MISFEICMVQLSVGFSRGSTVYCQGSRIVFLSFFLSFGRKISRFFGLVKNIPCEFYINFRVGTPCCSYKALK